MKIIITWYDEYEDEQVSRYSEKLEADNVLDAEANIAIMARHYQKRWEDKQNVLGEDADLDETDNEASREPEPKEA